MAFFRLESPLKKVKVRSEGAMHVDSPCWGIHVEGLRDMNLKSTGGRVNIILVSFHLCQRFREKTVFWLRDVHN
ncbi:hypothetical protein CEXT_522941 [Caerostris extrusa]|uniref:Uncharacterized protein n=1 Tax=Caerostris extrusa TaxID=172846 RepID=A0AAV4R246_CAEEX|nr:hypothetical protein CEXT_522941 [Caerostris extrusa]